VKPVSKIKNTLKFGSLAVETAATQTKSTVVD
jgi:hypothetical protein